VGLLEAMADGTVVEASRHPADTNTACRRATSGVRRSTAGCFGFQNEYSDAV